jgi:hypothetical protein
MDIGIGYLYIWAQHGSMAGPVERIRDRPASGSRATMIGSMVVAARSKSVLLGLILLYPCACAGKGTNTPTIAPAVGAAAPSQQTDTAPPNLIAAPSPVASLIDTQCANTPEAPADHSYKQALARGRKAVKAHHFDDAVDAFAAALEACDARALSELSWAAFQAGRTDRAKKAARLANGATADRNLRASALYNLGRIHQRDRELETARLAYRESLALRDNDIVKRRLTSLNPAENPLTPEPLIGPLSSIDAYCHDYGLWTDDFGDDPVDCYDEDAQVEASLTPPFAAVKPAYVESQETHERNVHVVIKTSRGLFVTKALGTVEPGYQDFALVDITVEHGILRVRHRASSHVRGWVDDEETMRGWVEDTHTESVLLCGQGRSGDISCVPPIATEAAAQQDDDLPPTFDIELMDDSTLIMRATNTGHDYLDTGARAGIHKLVFP